MTPLYKNISSLCQAFEREFHLIPALRKEKLLAICDYLSKKISSKQTAQLIVICTHNSRRSHIGQIWLATAADYYQLPAIHTFSGGTEATAFNPRAVKAMQSIGFEITTNEATSDNPKYKINWRSEMNPYLAFSKKYDAPPNPAEHFGAIMVCTEADEGCPVVLGSEARWSLPFDDPKAFDGTEQEEEKYRERAMEIGREMLYLMSMVEV